MRLHALPLLLTCLMLGACADGRQLPVAPQAESMSTLVALDVGGVPARVRVVDTHAARARGLSGVAQLAPDEGMLFVYPYDARRQFWMKDCLIGLDIAFLDADGRVVQVETMAPPRTQGGAIPQTTRSPSSAYVLEMPAGWFARHELGVGTRVHIPASVQRERAE